MGGSFAAPDAYVPLGPPRRREPVPRYGRGTAPPGDAGAATAFITCPIVGGWAARMGQGHDRHARRFQHGCRGIRSRAHGRRARSERRRDPHRAARRGVRAARDDVRRQHGRRRAGARERARGAGLVRAGQLGRADHAAVLHRRRLLELPPLALDARAGRERRPTTCAPASSGSSVRRSPSWWSSPAGLAALSLAGLPAELVATAGFRIGQPLWFLGVYLAVSALVPVMLRAHERARVLTPLAAARRASSRSTSRASRPASTRSGSSTSCSCGCSCSSSASTSPTEPSTASRPGALVGIAGGALALLAVLTVVGPYPVDMLVNLNPPTVCLVVLGVAQLALFQLARPRIRAWVERADASRLDLVRRRARDDRLPLAHARAHRARRPEPRGERGGRDAAARAAEPPSGGRRARSGSASRRRRSCPVALAVRTLRAGAARAATRGGRRAAASAPAGPRSTRCAAWPASPCCSSSASARCRRASRSRCCWWRSSAAAGSPWPSARPASPHRRRRRDRRGSPSRTDRAGPIALPRHPLPL